MSSRKKLWKNTEENFWGQTQERASGCVEWVGKTEKGGYGRVSWHGSKKLAHRVAAYLSGKLEDLDSTQCVLHRCDNPPCCNPQHLFIGTKKENTLDAVAKGRQATPDNRGERSGNAKLSNAQAEEIRRIYSGGGISQQKLGVRYGVGQMSVSKIVRGIAYNA
jgi:hypothetical protein